MVNTSVNGTLYVVATPIGNLEDISTRAVNVLRKVEIVAAEDTRHSAKLLNHLGIRAPELLAINNHNESQRTLTLISALTSGSDVALVSDAGTPLLSDPGFELVRACWQAQVRVIPVPGASAVVAALSACPIPTARFVFEGFLPAKGQQRLERLLKLRNEERALVIYEAPHRLADALRDMQQAFGSERGLFMAREMTKLHETLWAGTIGDAVNDLNQVAARGEYVCIVQGNPQPALGEVNQILTLLLAELAPAQAARLTAKLTGTPKNRVYKQALALAASRNSAPDQHQ